MVYNKTATAPQLVLLKKGRKGMSLDAYRVRNPDGGFVMDPNTGRPALFARNAKDWNAMQAEVFGMRGSYSIDPSGDPEAKLAESLAKSVEQGLAIGGAAGSIVLAPYIAAAGDVAGQAVARTGVGALARAGETTATEGAVTSTFQRGVDAVRSATGQTLTQRGGQVGIEMTERGLQTGAATATNTLGTTTVETGASVGGRASQGAFLTAMAASRARQHRKLEKHFERETSGSYNNMRRPIIPEPRTVPHVTPNQAAAEVRSRSGRFIVGTRESRAPVITLSDMRASVAAEQAQVRSGARIPGPADLYRSRGLRAPGVFQGNEVVGQEDRAYLGHPPIQTSTTPIP